MKNIVVATIKQWNEEAYDKFAKKISGKWCPYLIKDKNVLRFDTLKKIDPEYVFFPHWSWIIPEEIYSNFNCIVFHMTDLPFGRGGSPLQNLISRGIYETKISALKVDGGLDTGDIYFKEPVCIKEGSASEIFKNVSAIVFEKMIPRILAGDVKPTPQTGEPVSFKRRKPDESDIMTSGADSTVKLYDHIRMLDGEGYPKAFIIVNGVKLEFFDAVLKDGKLTGRFEVTEDE